MTKHKHKKKKSGAFQKLLLLLFLAGSVLCAVKLCRQDAVPAGAPSSFSEAGSTAEDAAGLPTEDPALPSPGTGTSMAPQAFDLSDVPAWSGEPVAVINDNVPFFTEAELSSSPFEEYGELDSLGRCTGAFACININMSPATERESISEIHPSGWQNVKYDGIEGDFLYNRCHLIAFGLTGQNANERNLITGTRYMNTEGMEPFEYETIGYIHRTHHHVLYRATPVFEGDNLVASGVLMEARSIEDDGLMFCVYAYNVQPGVTIDYETGESSEPVFTGSE